MTELIEPQPITNPLDVASPKPSEIVRNWPDAMWGRCSQRRRLFDGRVQFCARGILHETAGGAWGDSRMPQPSAETIMDVYGLTIGQVMRLQYVNDREGKFAAADYLESLGL